MLCSPLDLLHTAFEHGVMFWTVPSVMQERDADTALADSDY